MRIYTLQDKINDVADAWKAQFYGYEFSGQWFPLADGRPTETIWELLKSAKTAEQIEAIVGNKTWTTMKCEECGVEIKEAIRLGEGSAYGSNAILICMNCFEKAEGVIREWEDGTHKEFFKHLVERTAQVDEAAREDAEWAATSRKNLNKWCKENPD